MKNSESSLYIRFLKWASEKGTFTETEFKNSFSKLEYEVIDFQNTRDIRLYITYKEKSEKTPETRLMLSFEAKMKYLDFLELKESRETSKEAKRFSIFAIILSIVAIGISIYLSMKPVDVNIISSTTNLLCSLNQTVLLN